VEWTSFIPSKRATFSESLCCLQNSGQHTKSRYRVILIRPNNNESKLILGTFEVSLTTYIHTKPKTDIQTLYAQTNLGKADEDKQVNCRLTEIGNVLTKLLFQFRLFSPQTVTILKGVLYRVIVLFDQYFFVTSCCYSKVPVGVCCLHCVLYDKRDDKKEANDIGQTVQYPCIATL